MLDLRFVQLSFMSALILIALFFHGFPVVLQGTTRMNMLLFEGLDLFVPIDHQGFKVSTALADASVTRQLGLKRRLSGLKVSGLSLNG
ncbi:hypothetical protein ALP91_01146 [Pseudomonas savastanoi pv. glycinea]|nr:hypothetical protein ALO37_103050 [Pseudomonas savastanoi pv. glycinea]RMR44214.1 hypothetical protein ALP91_01146 [Pseudomonas savastanoi pv. glycinea]